MRKLALAVSTLLLTSGHTFAEIKVAVSIKPIHSLVASVMQGIGTPTLIVDGSNSPHTYNMKPSNVAALEQAEVIFWVGHELEAFLEKPLEALGQKATIISLLDNEAIKTLPVRDDQNFQRHEDEAEHQHDGADAHIWLDPENAKAIIANIAATLSKADAVNATAYQANAEKTLRKLDTLSAELETSLATVQGKGFIVFHDAYQYFETRFGLKVSGAISINPENPPGAKQITMLQKRITDDNIQCVFAEPQFDNKLVNLILEGTSAKSATLDPMGAALDQGPELYENLLRDLAQNLAACLSP